LKDANFSLTILEVDQARFTLPSSLPYPVFEAVAGMPLGFAEQDHAVGFQDLSHARFKDGIERWVVNDVGT
jgi:hypothetical protein